MDKLSFAPLIDIPLVGITLAVFIGHFNRWALRKDVDTSFNLASRLPRARIRVIAFFACILLVCWYGNLAVWSIVVLLRIMTCMPLKPIALSQKTYSLFCFVRACCQFDPYLWGQLFTHGPF